MKSEQTPVPNPATSSPAASVGIPAAGRSSELERLLPQGHRARLLLDLISAPAAAEKIQKSIGGHQAPLASFALWLYASQKGIGSAEELSWHCQHNAGFRWLSQGLDTAAAALASFRSVNSGPVDELLAEYLVGFRLAVQAGGKTPTLTDVQLLALHGEARKHVAQLREQIGSPLGEQTKRRGQLADQRRAGRAARVDAAQKGLQRLIAAQQAEAKRLAEVQRQAAVKQQAEAPSAAPKTKRQVESVAQVMVPGGYPVRPILGIEPMLPWSSADGSEARFKRILAGVAVFFLAISAVLMSYTPPPIERDKVEKVPERLAKLLEERKEEPKPEKIKVEDQPKPKEEKPEELKQEAPKPVDTPKPRIEKPSAEQIAAAREVAAQSGLVAMKDQLAALRSLGGGDAFKGDQVSAGAGGGSGSGMAERDLIGRVGTSGTGGVAGRAVAYTGGGQLAGRTATQVKALPGGAPSLAQIEKDAKSGKRSAENIKLAFDANKSAIYSIYRRALRQNPLLEGRVVLKLSIDKAGKVLEVTIVSSALKDPDLEAKLLERVKIIDFGASPENWTGTYQIDFVPSS